jgi:hypothetical protein
LKGVALFGSSTGKWLLRCLVIFIVTALIAVGLYSLGRPYRDGDNDDFRLTGVVVRTSLASSTDHGDVELKDIHVQTTHGSAEDFFQDKSSAKLYNHYQRDKYNLDHPRPGRAYNTKGGEINLDELPIGSTVEVTGRIRTNLNRSGWPTDRAVFEQLQVVSSSSG